MILRVLLCIQESCSGLNVVRPPIDHANLFVDALYSVTLCCSVLQCVVVCCSAVQCVAVCYSAAQCVEVCPPIDSTNLYTHSYLTTRPSIHMQTHCITPHHTAPRCNSLPHMAPHCTSPNIHTTTHTTMHPSTRIQALCNTLPLRATSRTHSHLTMRPWIQIQTHHSAATHTHTHSHQAIQPFSRIQTHHNATTHTHTHTSSNTPTKLQYTQRHPSTYQLLTNYLPTTHTHSHPALHSLSHLSIALLLTIWYGTTTSCSTCT